MLTSALEPVMPASSNVYKHRRYIRKRIRYVRSMRLSKPQRSIWDFGKAQYAVVQQPAHGKVKIATQRLRIDWRRLERQLSKATVDAQ